MMRLIAKRYLLLTVICQRAFIATGIVLAVAAIYSHKKHVQAEAFLDQIDLKARNTSGATFYATKKRLFVGQTMTRNEVVGYLKSINFVQSDDTNSPGSFQLKSNDTLVVNPRLGEFQPLSLTFRHGRIDRLEVTATPFNPTAGKVGEATLEPQALGAFITSVNGEEASRMFVRRYTLQFEEFRDTDLFFAILASEDTRFMDHGGTRFDRIFLNMLRRHQGGGSSITAQVIKNAVTLDRTHAVTRKIDEIFLASALEHRMSKEDIITLYVNDVFLGGGNGAANLYGFLAAAEQYFGKKTITELTLNETCILVAMLPKPNVFLDHARHGDYSQLREYRDRVLHRLYENWPDKYSTDRIAQAQSEDVRFVTKPYADQPMDTLCRAFIDYATQQQPLVDLGSLPPTEYSGLHFYTSIDPDLMRAAQRILGERLPALERRFPPVKGRCADGKKDRLLGAIVALDPRTGEVVAMCGGAGGKDGVQYSRFAVNAIAPPASTIKPFWVVKALAGEVLPNGERYTAGSVLNPANTEVNGWQPAIGLGGPGRVRTKLAVSADDFAVYTLKLIGFDEGKDFFQTLTGNTITTSNGQLAVGFGAGTEISPLNLSRAYSIFGNNGRLSEANPISEVYLDGRAVEFKRKPSRQVIDADAAYITTQLMRSGLGYGLDGLKGTARQAFARTGLSIDKIEMAGKTGSGPDSVWMISISPRLVVAVLVTYQCHSEIKNSQGMYSKDTAAFIWAEFIRSVHRSRPDLLSDSFDKPRNVVSVDIDSSSGCRSYGPRSITEVFIEGTEPAPCIRR